MEGFSPIELTEIVRRWVARTISDVEERRCYRFRGGRWYGGIATGDVVGCNLRCKFCWSWRFSHSMDRGEFYAPRQVFEKLVDIASSKGYKYLRLSGGEPTISWSHLMEVLKLVEETKYIFILETNGILIGYSNRYAKDLAKFSNIVVRVSFKGASAEEFHMLTGAEPQFYELQFKALENLMENGMKPGEDFYPAIMLSFTTDENYRLFKKRLSSIHPVLVESIDEEYVILYPHVVEILNRYRLKPKVVFKPNSIPEFMI
ncbi:MAG: radical SAM protein [Ignisphaera sp.]